MIGVLVAAARGQVAEVTDVAMSSARQGVETAVGLLGVMVLWLGLSRVAERAGLVDAVAGLVRPALRRLFPDIPKDHPAMGAMVMNITANLLGLGQAATPFGLKAMQALQALNPRRDTASDAMVTFLVLNTSGITLVPAIVIGLRAQYGSANPGDILLPTILASTAALVVGLTVDALVRRR